MKTKRCAYHNQEKVTYSSDKVRVTIGGYGSKGVYVSTQQVHLQVSQYSRTGLIMLVDFVVRIGTCGQLLPTPDMDRSRTQTLQITMFHEKMQ